MIYSFQYIVSIHAEYHALKRNAYYDDLTEIPNRRKSSIVFDEMIEVANKRNTSFSVLFFDIDYFKKINDNFGHDVGDTILQEFASLIEQKLSKNEFLGRWGGEEFIVYTPLTIQEAVNHADNIRIAIELNQFTSVIGVTSSVGVASYCKGDTVDSLLKRADLALYEAKKMGRNCVIKNEVVL